MKPLSIEIIPAQPGFFTVYDYQDENLVDIGEQVIAWRIETYQINKKDEVFSTCIAITVDGDVASNCIGVQGPDMTITVFEDANYRSLAELLECRYPKQKN